MAKNIESLVEKEIQKGSTPLKLDSVMVPAEGFRDIDSRERLINVLQYLLRVRGHKKLIWNDTLSANNVYMDVFLGKTDFRRASLITGREEIYQHNIRFVLSMRIVLITERIWHGMRIYSVPLMKVHSRRHLSINHQRQYMENTVSFSG